MEKLTQDFKNLKVANMEKLTNEQKKSAFLEVYSVLKFELLNDQVMEYTKEMREWVEEMLDYNVPRGKLSRGLSVVESYEILKEGNALTEDEFFLATTLGWCVEWAHAAALVLDDVMDNSLTRRGQPCWFRVPKVSMIALNDATVLLSQVHRILKFHFRTKPYFVDLIGLFTEVEYLTSAGQMVDLVTTHEGKKDLSRFTLSLFYHIAKYKTAYYSFYLPVACALLMSGENLDNYIALKDILSEMGTHFQAQDDYMDCFGESGEVNKIGTDIEEFKCSWLLVEALKRCNEEQKKLLNEHYGKANPEDVATVKSLYIELGLQEAFAEYETRVHEKFKISIEAHPNKRMQAILKSFLGKIYRREGIM